MHLSSSIVSIVRFKGECLGWFWYLRAIQDDALWISIISTERYHQSGRASSVLLQVLPLWTLEMHEAYKIMQPASETIAC